MFCSKCGSRVDGGHFCHFCGMQIARRNAAQPIPPPMPMPMPMYQMPPPPPMPLPMPMPPPAQPQAEVASSDDISIEELLESNEDNTDEVVPSDMIKTSESASAQNKKTPQKQYFGKTALVFCLIAIGVLSVTCGVFMTLYFGTIL